MPIAQASGAARNCHTEMPAARATISSDERVSRQKQMMPPSSTPNGRISMQKYGRCSAAISSARLAGTSGRVAARRSRSMKSNRDTSPVSAAISASTLKVNWRAM